MGVGLKAAMKTSALNNPLTQSVTSGTAGRIGTEETINRINTTDTKINCGHTSANESCQVTLLKLV